jgi:GTP cyclohydrolase I
LTTSNTARDASRSSSQSRIINEKGSDGHPIVEYVHRLLVHVGENPGREGLVKTPERVATAIERLTCGYRSTVAEVVNGAVFEEPHESMVLVRDIEL